MGCDGGTIPKRCELVPEKKKKEKKDKNFARIAKWSTCALSNRKLAVPIVGCRLGRLYNKEAILEYILNHKSKNHVKHIRKIKDVKELNLVRNPNYKESYLTNIEMQTTSQFICPISNLSMSGKYEFVFFWKCGCVISHRALKEIKTSSCVVCGTAFTSEDIVNINPIDTENTLSSCQESNNQSHKKIIKSSLKVESKPKQKLIESAKNINPSAASNAQNYDPKASSIYKSLFTSSEKYKNQAKDKKSHWVTTFNYSV
ncbi:hypothetical protein HZS_6999 [Henneguya salminicola]|nr:hypothetical protein HZS_6999 [Henneguya salminicola]